MARAVPDNDSMSKSRALPDPTSTPGTRLHEGALGQVMGYQLAQAAVVTSAVFDAQAATGHDLRPVEFTLLALVRHNDGLTAAQLAKALAVSPPALVTMVDKLIQRGLVERRPHVRDRRALHLQTTEAGRTLADTVADALHRAEAQAFGRLSLAERLMLLELLHKAASCRSST